MFMCEIQYLKGNINFCLKITYVINKTKIMEKWNWTKCFSSLSIFLSLYLSICPSPCLYFYMHGCTRVSICRVRVEVCPLCIYTCVSGYFQCFKGDIIIGHCALHWSIYLFIQSVNTYLPFSIWGIVLCLGIQLWIGQICSLHP